MSFTLLWGPLLNERASERVVVARVVRTIHSRSTFLVSMPPSLVSHGYPDQVPVRLIPFQSCSWPLLLVPLLPNLLPATFPHHFRCVAPEVSCMCTFSLRLETTDKRSHKDKEGGFASSTFHMQRLAFPRPGENQRGENKRAH